MPKNFSSWPKGWPRSLDYPEIPVFEILNQTVGRVPYRIALIFQGLEVTYRELGDLSDRFAAALVQLGVRKGDRVAINLPNCPQFAIAYYGSLKAGAVFTPVSPLLVPKEFEYQLNDSGAETLVMLDSLYAKFREVIEATQVHRVITTSLADCTAQILASLRSATKAVAPETQDLAELLGQYEPALQPVQINPKEDLAHLAYTGGTTGRSKAVMVTHQNAVTAVIHATLWIVGATIEMVKGQIRFRYPDSVDPARDRIMQRDTEVALLVPPWYHAMGSIGLNNQIFLGSTIVVFTKFDSTEYLNALVRYKATYATGAPQLYRSLFNHPGFDKYDLSSIKLAVSGAAPLPPSLLEEMLKAFSGVVMDSYGLTETTQCVTLTPPTRDGIRLGSVGLPLFDTEIRIVDPETAEPLAPGQEGEICVRGPQVMKGYWNRPEETAETLKDGWLFTGDIGREDEDGCFYVTDRKKDMIIYKGHNIYPRELEEIIFRHPAVELCAVVGKPDADGGEIPFAVVQLKPGAKATSQEIIGHVNQQVAHYKKVREVVFTDQIPVSGPGKVLKRVIKERFGKGAS